jgi:hypothetical protein
MGMTIRSKPATLLFDRAGVGRVCPYLCGVHLGDIPGDRAFIFLDILVVLVGQHPAIIFVPAPSSSRATPRRLKGA